MMAPKDDGDAGLLLHFGGGGGRTLVSTATDSDMEAKQQQQQQQQQEQNSNNDNNNGKPPSNNSATASATASATSSTRASPTNSTEGSPNGSVGRTGDSVKSSNGSSSILNGNLNTDSSDVKARPKESDMTMKLESKNNGGIPGNGSSSKHYHSKGGEQRKTGFSIKKKKKRDKSRDKSSSRSKKRGMHREARMAADTSVNTLRTLKSVIFQKDSFISNPVPLSGHGRTGFDDFQFDDAPEVVDHARLKQHHSSDSGSKARPPFGYFSIHPSSLSLHPESAVHHYYPMTIHMMGDTLHLHPHQQHHQQQSKTQYHQQQEQPNHQQLPNMQNFARPGFRASFTGPDRSPGHHGGMAQLHHPNMVAMNHPQLQQAQMSQQHHVQLQQQRHQHPGMSPGSTQHPLVNIPTKHLPPTNLVPGLTPQQQTALHHQYQQQIQHQHGRPPSFLEYAAAFVKRQQHHQQQQQQQQHHQSQQISQQQQPPQGLSQEQMQQVELQRQESLKKDQLERAAMLKNALKNVTGVPRVRPKEQQQHKRQQQQPSQGGSKHRLEESPSTSGTSAEKGGVSAMMALAAAREVNDPATAAALLQNFALQKQEKTENKHPLAKPDISSAIMAKKRINPKIVGGSDERNGITPKYGRNNVEEESCPLLTGTDILETLPMLRYTPPDSAKMEPVTDREFRQCDVLLGRGGMTNHHIGNTHFRSLVCKFRYNYHAAKKGAKGQLSKKLANFVRHKGGRFLQKDDDENVWYECGDQRAHGKCAQALREGSAEVVKEANAMEAVERDRQRILPRSTPKEGFYHSSPFAGREQMDRQNRMPHPQMSPHLYPAMVGAMSPSMALSTAHSVATGQHMAVQSGARRPESSGKPSTNQGGQRMSVNHNESPAADTDENQSSKSSRVRDRDWENEGSSKRASGDDNDGEKEEGREEEHDEEEHQEDEDDEESPASKRAKTHHVDESEEIDYI